MVEAERQCRAILAERPSDAATLHLMGLIQFRQGDINGAVDRLGRAVTLSPRDAAFRSNLGNAFATSGRLEEAVDAYRSAIAIAPLQAETHSNLGSTLRDSGIPLAAAAACKTALCLSPALADALVNLGAAHRSLGEHPLAQTAFERSIAVYPANARAYYGLSLVKRFSSHAPEVAAMEKLLDAPAPLDPDSRIALHFALGAIYEQNGAVDTAMPHYLEGNRLKRERIHYDECATLESLGRIAQIFDLPSKVTGTEGYPTDAPIFIIGMPRSGTSLIEQILASHGEVIGAGERIEFHRLVERIEKVGIRYPDFVQTLSPEEIRKLGEDYLVAMRLVAPEARRIVDKMPGNFQYVGLIHSALPNAKIIHCRRDPADTCLSCYTKLFTSSQPFAYEMGELGRYYRAYEKLMDHWRRILPAGVMLEVSYEEVLNDLEGQTRRLLNHCGLDWQPACLDFHKTNRAVRTASAEQVRQPIYQSSMGRWKRVAPYIDPLLQALGGGDGLKAAGPETPSALPDPNAAESWHKSGLAALESGEADHAIARICKAIGIRGDMPTFHTNLGVALRAANRLEEAGRAYRTALALAPQLAEIWSNLGENLWNLAQLPQSAVACQRAITIDRAHAQAWANLGNTLVDIGQIEEAADAYAHAASLEPRVCSHYRHLATVKRLGAETPAFRSMEALLSDIDSLSTDGRIDLHFALAASYEHQGRHQEAFDHLLAGNALKRRQNPYDETKALNFLTQIQSAFTPALMADKASLGDQSEVPVFVVGMPRSGTSLVEQIIASHPEAAGAGERTEFFDLLVEIEKSGFPLPSKANALTGEILSRLGSDYVDRLRPIAPGAARIIDKMPANFSLIGLIHLALPRAKIIHCQRDPLDTCLSCFSTLFSGNQPFTYDLAELGRYYRAYEALMAHWRRVLPEGVMLDVRYEDVVADLEGQARRMVAHCGLEWDAACLDFHRTSRPVRTTSASQVRKPIYGSSVRRWERHAKRLGPLITALGQPVRERIRGGTMTQITIDNEVYELESLPEAVRQQIVSLQFADTEIQRLQMQLSIAQTARAAYASALKEQLPKR